ncbi:MAG: hypothetical protein M0P49_00640 [Bacilli bacterium]|nr:hypothetical protein [Bacilli bacterium]
MIIIEILDSILDELKKGNISVINDNTIRMMNLETQAILTHEKHTTDEILKMEFILAISNILYNNTDMEKLPLEDGIYDLLLEQYRQYNPYYQVGAKSIRFKNSNVQISSTPIPLIQFIDTEKLEDFIFIDDLSKEPRVTKLDTLTPCIIIEQDSTSKRSLDTKHMYPELVGTLDKCKFVLNSQAEERGVLNDSNVRILERDFFNRHIQSGLLDPNRVISVIVELKYDGVSVEGEVSNMIHTARTRGDANEDIGADITSILHGYSFKHAKEIPAEDKFGMKFEAIMTYVDLWKYNLKKEKKYKNCRTAIISIFSSLDATNYKEFITLVPLATSLGIDRLTEVEFMNKYYHSGEYLRYSIITGTYVQVLFQIKRFVEEAEYMRPFMPFMYDGVVISYLDEDLITRLGRSNSVNQYSVAVKFNPLVKQSIFRGYSYTVGQDGCITPKIHYDPVEFYGTIHDKSSGHSYERFKNLGLRIGDFLNIEFTADVMPYVTKPDNSYNVNNTNPIVEFITICPSCGNKLIVSKTGKTIFCNNISCPERNLNRMIGMLQKLNLKDFAEASLTAIAKFSLVELLNLTKDDVAFLGDVTSDKFIQRMNDLKTTPIYDYRIIGSIGFTGVAIEKWKLILSKYTLSEILNMKSEDLRSILLQIKGIGPATADTLIQEFEFHRNDLEYINQMKNVMISKGIKSGKKIRFTGFRNTELVEKLVAMGHDASEGGITKTTDILLVPYPGYTSTKTASITENTLIVDVGDFILNMNKYLQ